MPAAKVMHMANYRRPEPVSDEAEYTFNSYSDMFAFVSGNLHEQHDRRDKTQRKSYASMSRVAGVTPTTISKMASGETKYPRYTTVAGILDALGFEQVTRRRR